MAVPKKVQFSTQFLLFQEKIIALLVVVYTKREHFLSENERKSLKTGIFPSSTFITHKYVNTVCINESNKCHDENSRIYARGFESMWHCH